MRVMLLLGAGLVALVLVLSGCGGDEEQPQPQQAQQAPSASEQQEETAARPQPERAAQSTEAQAEQDQAVAEQEQADTAPQEEDAARFSDPLLAEAYAAFIAWSEGLESIDIDVQAEFNLAGLAAQMSASVSAQFEPLTVLTSLDATELLAMFGGGPDADEDAEEQLLIMAILLTEDGVYMTMPQAGGWIDLTGEADGVFEGLTGMLGGDPSQLADPDQLGLAFGCIEAVSGSVSVGSHDGQPAWVVDCEIDVDALTAEAAAALQEQGLELVDVGIDSMHLHMAISQESGAPLLVRTDATLRDAFGFSDDEGDDESEPQFYINTTTHLRSWNEPIDFPVPEPIVDGSLVDLFSDSSDSDFSAADAAPPELLDAEQLLDLSASWADNRDELDLQFVTQAVIDGESRLAATTVRGSRSQGVFETSVNIDDNSSFRLYWNRDGIWVSDAEENGEPIWVRSNPALLGFAGKTVDDFLAEPDRLTYEPFRDLLGFSWVTRTIEGGRPPVYELVIESGYQIPGDEHFELIAELLRADTAELLADSIRIEEIDYYSVVITLMGDDGELVSQVTTAEFVTDAGRVELLASLNLVSDGPIAFSAPPE